MSGRKAPAPSPARSATASAAASRPSPTPISFSAGSAPTAFSAARCGSTSRAQARAGGARRQAARARSHAGGRRHPAHRHHQDVPHGALGHHRARPRCRRFHARRLWRRRAAARRHGRARAAHRQGRDPARARAFLRLRHAGRGSAARFRQHLVHAAGRGFVCRHGNRSTPRWSGADARRCSAARSRSPASRCSARPTCAMSGRSTPSPSSCRSSCSRREDRDGIKQRFDAVHETRYGYSAPGEKAEIVSLRSAVTGPAAQAGIRADRRRASREPPPAAFRGTRPVYFAEAGRHVDTPTYDRATLVAGNRIAGPALIEEYASTTVRPSRATSSRSMPSATWSSKFCGAEHGCLN